MRMGGGGDAGSGLLLIVIRWFGGGVGDSAVVGYVDRYWCLWW